MKETKEFSMWQEGQNCAVALTFDLDGEAVWIAEDPANKDKPGLLSQGKYGPKVGVPLILSLLERTGVKATFFILGIIAEQYPDTVAAIAEAGHELAVHSYTHDSPISLTPEEEENALLRTREILKTFSTEVVGYRSPSWDFSKFTMDFLQKNKFVYSSNMMDDIRPYIHPETDVVELPIQWILDDAAHFWFALDAWDKKISTPSEVREIWEAEFEGIYQLGGAFILTMHPQIIGRPYRIKMLEGFIQFLQSHEGAWLTTCAEIAAQARNALT
jgi:peptidoglycan/xylan/chitin deacetylase (PgdA/CDA1 family)